MQIWKRTVSFFLALTMVFTMLPVFALAEETEQPAQEETLTQEQPPQEETVTEEQTPQEEVTKTEDEREPVDEESENVQTEELLEESEEEFLSLELVEGLTDLAAAPMLLSADMHLSEAGKQFIKKNEGCVLTAYWDVNAYSIGYGHHGSDVYSGMTITQAQADAYFESDIVRFENAVNTMADENDVTLNQYQFDALTDFTYNEGAGVFVGHDRTIERYLRNGWTNYSETEWVEAFCLFDVGNSGLQARHTRQGKLFYSGNYGTGSSGGGSQASVPSAPTNFTATYVDNQTAALSWSASSGAASYEVQYYSRSKSKWETDKTLSATSYNMTELANYDSWDFRVCAKNSTGSSDWLTITYNKYAETPGNQNSSIQFSAQKAVDYALKYNGAHSGSSYNPAYTNLASSGGDCTNFVSQCIKESGFATDSIWKPYTEAWSSTGPFIRYFGNSKGVPIYVKSGISVDNLSHVAGNEISANTIHPGDVFFGKNAKGAKYGHAMIAVRVTSTGVYYCGHTTNRCGCSSCGTFMDFSNIQVVVAFSKLNNQEVDDSSQHTEAPYITLGNNLTLPQHVELNERFALWGSLTVNYGKIKSVWGAIYNENGSIPQASTGRELQGFDTVNAMTYEINSGSINDNLTFRSLPAGNYVYVVKAVTEYNGITADREYIRQPFTVGGTPAHNYVENFEAAHPHKYYKKCSSCGDYYYTGDTLSYYESCTTCNPPKVYFSIDVNGELNGSDISNVETCGSFDIYVNGVLKGNDVTDFYDQTIEAGSNYEIKDIKAKPGYVYKGLAVGSAPLTGVANGHIAVKLAFCNPPKATLSKSAISLDLEMNPTVSMQFDYQGNTENGYGYAFFYDKNVINLQFGEDQTFSVVAVNPGKTTLSMKLIEDVTDRVLDTATCEITVQASGTCDNNISWVIDANKKLTISGNGDMDWPDGRTAPWIRYYPFVRTAEIKPGVTAIEAMAFYQCKWLESVVIPAGVTSIGKSAFYECTALQQIELPASVAGIERSAFAGCTNLQSIELSSGLRSMAESAFFGCTNLETIIIPEGISTIPGGAFMQCTKLSEVSIPESVSTIDTAAFRECSALTTVHYAGSQKTWNAITIGDNNEPLSNATINYAKSDTINGTCGDNLTWLLDEDGTLTISGTGTMTNYSVGNYAPWYRYAAQIQKVVIETGATSVGNTAFYNLSNLAQVELPNTILTVGEWAFYKCPSLSEIVLPDSVVTIQNYAFQESGLTEVTLSNSLQSIGDQVFMECRAFANPIIIPASVTNIGRSAFSYSAISELRFLGNAPTFHSSALTYNTFTCYYPEGNTTWTSANMKDYGGHVTWIAESEGAKPVEITPTIPGAAQAGISVSAPEGGWKEGTNTFTVSCDKPCVVAVSYDGGQTFVRLTASDSANGKSFTAENMTADTQLAVQLSGDTNGDGVLTNSDAVSAKAASLGKKNATALQKLAMDVNGDGVLTNSDMVKMKAASLGKTTLNW